ncbi:hypothetical protein TNCV_475711 [Trichonephila clavipes]|nr:hypothetical protein TNCV_475711 [Trichonephila clavipes]
MIAMKFWKLEIRFQVHSKLDHAILTAFESTNACESSFSEMNNIKNSLKIRFADDFNSACILLKVTFYNPNSDIAIPIHSSLFHHITLTERRHPTVMEILLPLGKLERKGFDIIFSWVSGDVGILGYEQADNAARSMSVHMQQPVCYQDL